MLRSDLGEPRRPAGTWLLSAPLPEAAVYFLGCGPHESAEAALAALGERPGRLAHLRQIHSARVVEASDGGPCGEGDALWTRSPGHALAIATADCVPVVLTGPGYVAAVHAGWRGIAAGVVPATVADAPLLPEKLQAWIGPAIGPCCYEVGEDVALAVEVASGPEVVLRGRGPRPYLDLVAAVATQLESAGVATLATTGQCTRCAPGRWWSYRREGRGAGRNYALAWLR